MKKCGFIRFQFVNVNSILISVFFLLCFINIKNRYPENTVPGFIAAAEIADGFETDLHLTKDGKIVLSHDETLDRCTNCTGKISDLTFDCILLLKCSYILF